jgi:nucleotide-binding universal stress UspA family protein
VERKERAIMFERILVLLDGSQRAECALPIAVRIAEAHGARLLLAHVVRTPEMARHEPLTVEEQHLLQQVVARNQQAAADYLARMQAQLSIPTETRLVISKHVVPSLYAVLDDAHTDLVLLTAHGYSGHTAWPCGSVATSFIAHASVPLFIVQDVAHGEQPASAVDRHNAAGGVPAELPGLHPALAPLGARRLAIAALAVQPTRARRNRPPAEPPRPDRPLEDLR